MAKSNLMTCPCGLGLFEACCGRYINHSEHAPTAEALMRSRYTAYVLADQPYLLETWHLSSCPKEAVVDNQGVKWLGLDVLDFQHDLGSTNATVEFVARYKFNGRAKRLHELSTFVLDDGRWLYVSGITPS